MGTIAQYVTLRHLGGELKTALIIGYEGYRLRIKWGPLAGVYDINLKKNILIGAPAWSVVDIEAAWVIWRIMARPKTTVVKARPYDLSGILTGKKVRHG